MEIKASLVEKESKKGNKYKCVVLKLTDSYEKVVFLEPAELELLKAVDSKEKNSPFDF